MKVPPQPILQQLSVVPNLTHPNRNGRLVMNLPMWGGDTEEMAKRVVIAFSSFAHGT